MSKILAFLILVLLTACVPASNSDVDSPTLGYTKYTVAENLLGPVGLALLPDGTLAIAEEGNGDRDTSAGITLVTPQGKSGRLISGLLSTRDAGDLAGVPLVSVSPDGLLLYAANFGSDHLWTLPVSSFSNAADNAEIPAAPFLPEQLGKAMGPLNNVRLTNAFDMTYDSDGNPVVSDASQNGIATTTKNGETRFFHRFEQIADPASAVQMVEAVPTGIERFRSQISGDQNNHAKNDTGEGGADEYWVTLFSGCPYPADAGQLVAIDTERNQRTILDGLNLPIDIAQGPDGTRWLLEFARFTQGASCFDGSGYQPNSGRLSIVDSNGARQTVIDNLNFPGAVLPSPDGSIYISEVLSGRVVHYIFDDAVRKAVPLSQQEKAAHQLVPLSYQQSIENENLKIENEAMPQFTNVAAELGLTFEHGAFRNGLSTDHVAAMGAGLCWLDFDRDGWLDLYLINSHSLDEIEWWTEAGEMPTNALFRNLGGTFEEISQASNTDLGLRGNGCVAADFNLDGWTDLFVTAYGPNVLLWNNGDGTFTEDAGGTGVFDTGVFGTGIFGTEEDGDQPEWSSAASVGDLNGDGWPDLFVAGYIDLSQTIPKPTGHFPQDFYGIADHLYINQGTDVAGGPTTFREVTTVVGLTRAERGLGSLLTDLDGDGDLDLYIANDGHPNRLYENQPLPDDPENVGFRFIDLTERAGVGDPASSMGVAGGDYDLDGELDLFVTNWDRELNSLYRNLGAEGERLTFQYSTYRMGMAGIGNNLTGWGTHLIDFDHDMDLDIVTVNGHVPVTDFVDDAELIRYYQNRTRTRDRVNEGAGNFFDWTRPAGLKMIGPLMARGSAAADYDNDGDLDVAINTIGGTPVLLRNNHGQTDDGRGNWLVIDAGRVVPGLRVVATLPDGTRLVREVVSGSSYLASEDPRMHFGLGRAGSVSRVEIRWPDGAVEIFEDVEGNQFLRLE